MRRFEFRDGSSEKDGNALFERGFPHTCMKDRAAMDRWMELAGAVSNE